MNFEPKKVWVTGHKNPDTDSICSAIAYASLKSEILSRLHQGESVEQYHDFLVADENYAESVYVPGRAGQISTETEYVLNTFNVPAPVLMNQIRTQVCDINIRRIAPISSDYSLKKAVQMGCGAVCFEGNIEFYGKSGFTYASEYGIRYHGLPEGEDASFFLCKELIPGYLDGVTGEYATPQGYFVDEAEAEVFDGNFPPKVKQKLPGQIF